MPEAGVEDSEFSLPSGGGPTLTMRSGVRLCIRSVEASWALFPQSEPLAWV